MTKNTSKDGKCFSCCKQKILTKEHVFPQALGGKLSVSTYCKECNERFGSEIDSQLIKNLGYFATTININRDRGKNQPYDLITVKDATELTYDGKKLSIKKPIFKIEIEKDGYEVKAIDITARTESELYKKIASIKRKYNLSSEKQKIFKEHHSSIDTKMSCTFDNSLIRRAIAKIAYNLICIKLPESYILSASFDDIREYIRFGGKIDLAAANFSYTQFMSDYTRPLHKIHISLNKRSNIVAGFVCLFGTFRYAVLISKDFQSHFEWPGLDYTFDPFTSKKIFGNIYFRSPELSIDQLLSPNDSLQFILNELSKGYKIIEQYNKGYKFLKIEID
ncbi:MAG: HNH endonuclease [Desulfobacterales bacterium]|nr:HNH endonuclease [Desulfobacterales bacterium]